MRFILQSQKGQKILTFAKAHAAYDLYHLDAQIISFCKLHAATRDDLQLRCASAL